MAADPLLPAEAALLVSPRRSAAPHCLQAALLSLVGRGHLAIGEEGRFLRRHVLHLRPGDGKPLPPHLAKLKNGLNVYALGGGLKASEVVRALQKNFGNDYRHYVHDVVAPPLIERGLLRRETRHFISIFPYLHYQRTVAGDAAVGPLLRLLDDAGDMKKLVRTDPRRALAIARAAGILLVLSPAARAQLPKLKKLLAERGDGGSAGLYIGGEDDDELTQLEIGIDVGLGVLGELDGWIDSIGAIGDFTGGDGGDGGDGGGGD